MATKPSTKPSRKATASLSVVSPDPDLAAADAAEAANPDQLRIKDLLDRVAAATDQPKNKLRSVVEATLSELGRALEAGEGINLPQLGKIRIVNSRTEDQGTIMTLKLRRMQGKSDKASGENEALAEVSEDS